METRLTRQTPQHDTKTKLLKVEQSFFTLIALFSLKIGRCCGRNWLN